MTSLQVVEQLIVCDGFEKQQQESRQRNPQLQKLRASLAARNRLTSPCRRTAPSQTPHPPERYEIPRGSKQGNKGHGHADLVGV